VISSTKIPLQTYPETEIFRLISDLLNTNPYFLTNFSNKVFSVGGFVRDQILKVSSNDLDLVIEQPGGSEKISNGIHAEFLNETTAPYQKGLGYPIWSLSFKTPVKYNGQFYQTQNGSVDFADTQKECFPDPTTRQRITTYGSLYEDIRRRDFTINMLAQNLTTLDIIDLSGVSFSDLKSGTLQTHPENNPDQIFADDPLRMLRAIRFSCKYNFKMTDEILTSIQKNVSRVRILSAERTWAEFKKIILNGNLESALKQMDQVGLFQEFFEDLNSSKVDFKNFNLEPKNIVLNLIILFKQLNPDAVQKNLARLKIDTDIGLNVYLAIDGLDQIEKKITTWLPYQVRGFLRKYFNQIHYFKLFRPDLSQIIDTSVQIPLQKTAYLSGNDMMNLLNAQGPQIKILLNAALDIEDELVLKYNTEPSNKIIQTEVLDRLKKIKFS
jgi:tRNA nucleotidyltransferase/poly(A) polymerase